jgi:membrane protein
MQKALRLFRLAVWGSFQHDIFTIARAAAYYSILTLFPALMIVATVLAAFDRTRSYLIEIAKTLHQVMPPGTARGADPYFQGKANIPVHILISACVITVISASGIIVSWMEGFCKAYRLPYTWNVVKQRVISIALVLATLVPMTVATISVAFGFEIELWVIEHTIKPLGPVIIIVWTLLRWVIALLTSIAVLTLIYHFGIPRWQAWYRVTPGATVATILWFGATEVFGWYMVNFATYNAIYGPLGAAIALLVWMYILSLIVLLGAEFNATMYPRTVTTLPAATPGRRAEDLQSRVKPMEHA